MASLSFVQIGPLGGTTCIDTRLPGIVLLVSSKNIKNKYFKFWGVGGSGFAPLSFSVPFSLSSPFLLFYCAIMVGNLQGAYVRINFANSVNTDVAPSKGLFLKLGIEQNINIARIANVFPYHSLLKSQTGLRLLFSNVRNVFSVSSL